MEIFAKNFFPLPFRTVVVHIGSKESATAAVDDH